jgi:transcriptional regulator with XRE-family HTH domain
LKPTDLQARAMRAAGIYKRHGISQAKIASFVGASQGQVSRLLGGKAQRANKLFEEICLYAERLEGGVSIELVQANDDLVRALAETWDGTAGHAKALANVIRSLSGLYSNSR